jgi:hypothetical protein
MDVTEARFYPESSRSTALSIGPSVVISPGQGGLANFAVGGTSLREVHPPRRLRAVRMNTFDPIGIRSSGKS